MDQTDRTPATLPCVNVTMLRADYEALRARARRMGIDPEALAGQLIILGLSKRAER